MVQYTPISEDRSLHFVVRHLGYRQAPGYGTYLNDVLRDLNAHPPKGARALLEDAAHLMSGKLEWRDGQRCIHSSSPIRGDQSPSEQRWHKFQRIQTHVPNMDILYDTIDRKKIHRQVASIEHDAFGLLQHEYDDPPNTLVTPVLSRVDTKNKPYRLYMQTVERNVPNFSELSNGKAFSYTLADGSILPLMQILDSHGLQRVIETRATTLEMSNEDKQATMEQYGDQSLSMLHPLMHAKEFRLLVSAVGEQWDVLCAKIDHAQGDVVPQEKLEALATIYWLVAQTTPVYRGGSAYANLILEHLGYCLGQQGYENALPAYTKEGVDLWAEAATTELATFKKRFAAGEYMDLSLSDEQVKQRLAELAGARQTNTPPALVIQPAAIKTAPVCPAQQLM